MQTYKNVEYDETRTIDRFTKEYLKDGKRVFWEKDYVKEAADIKAAKIKEIDDLPDLKAVKEYLKKIQGLDEGGGGEGGGGLV